MQYKIFNNLSSSSCYFVFHHYFVATEIVRTWLYSKIIRCWLCVKWRSILCWLWAEPVVWCDVMRVLFHPSFRCCCIYSNTCYSHMMYWLTFDTNLCWSDIFLWPLMWETVMMPHRLGCDCRFSAREWARGVKSAKPDLQLKVSQFSFCPLLPVFDVIFCDLNHTLNMQAWLGVGSTARPCVPDARMTRGLCGLVCGNHDPHKTACSRPENGTTTRAASEDTWRSRV